MRHPLARALASVGMNSVDVAAQLGVDPKTVERWFTGRVPYPRFRNELSRLTGWQVGDLWPDAVRQETRPAGDEVRMTYAHRSEVAPDVWRRHFSQAVESIDVVVYSGLFLVEDSVIQRVFRERASAGVRVRIALGDPDGSHVARRGADEGIDDAMAGRIRNALVLLRPLSRVPGVEIRLHDTVLYDSIFRADDEVLVNAHVYGVPAAHSPVIHLQRASDDGMTSAYVAAAERVWAAGRPL